MRKTSQFIRTIKNTCVFIFLRKLAMRSGTLRILLYQMLKWANQILTQCWFVFWYTRNRPQTICSSMINCEPIFYEDVLEGFENSYSHETRHCRQMDALSWQRPMSYCPFCHIIFDLQRKLWFSSSLIHLTSVPVIFC